LTIIAIWLIFGGNKLMEAGMIKKIATLAVMIVLSSIVSSQVVSGSEPGKTTTVFNRKFIYRLKPMMPYEQLVKIIGSPGTKVEEHRSSSASVVRYHWDGGRRSVLNVTTVAGKLADATMTSPNQRKFSLGKNGKIADLGD
jgi:hypothetical protein